MAWLTLLPPMVAIALAVYKREVIAALLVALFTSEFLQHAYNPVFGAMATLERIVAVFGDADNTRILVFSLLIGALLAFIRDFGGVAAFVDRISKTGLVNGPRRVGLVTTFTGIAIFIETNLSVLTAGIFSQSLFDSFHLSRARLAYVIDSTCAPVSVLILVNAWGAYILQLVAPYELANPVASVAYTIPLNFYAWFTLLLVFYTVSFNRSHGPMRQSDAQASSATPELHTATPTRSRYMLLPLAVMVLGILAFMVYTGHGKLLAGSGSRSVFWGTALAILVAYALLRYDKKEPHRKLVEQAFSGMGKLLPLVTTVLLAMAIGASMRALGTGAFVAGMVGDFLPAFAVAPLVFISAAVISFTTGTSWGTFGILIPIAIPVAQSMDLPVPLVLAAMLGGGVFGDHCSPISDTTIISSLASGCDHLEHVRTQLPYALVAGLLSTVAYALAGWWAG